MPSDNPFDLNSKPQRGRTIMDALRDAHGRELNRRIKESGAMSFEDAEKVRQQLPFNAFVDEQRRAFEASGDKETAKLLQDVSASKEIALGPQRAEDASLATAESYGRVAGSGLGLAAEAVNPLADGGVSRSERLDAAKNGTSFMHDVERLGQQSVLGFIDTISLGARKSITEAAIEARRRDGAFQGTPLAGMDTQQIFRGGEGGGDAINGQQADENAMAAYQGRQAQDKGSSDLLQQDLVESGVSPWLMHGFRKAGEIGALFTGAGYVSRLGNVLKVAPKAAGGMNALGRALQNPIINMAAWTGLQTEGEIRNAELQGDFQRASAMREGQAAQVANAAAFGAIGGAASWVGNAASRGLLKLVPGIAAQRAMWLGKSIGEIKGIMPKFLVGATHVAGKSAEFALFPFFPTPYATNAQGQAELSPWLTTILNPVKISEQIKGENQEWLDAVAGVFTHGAEAMREEALAGGLTSLLTMGKARVGKMNEFHNPFGMGTREHTDPAEQARLFEQFQREANVAARRALTPQERKAVREGIAEGFKNAANKGEQVQAVVDYVLAGAEAKAKLLKRYGVIPRDTPTVTDAIRRRLEEVIGPEIFNGKVSAKDAPGLGTTGELVADPERPGMPGRRFEVLRTEQATQKLPEGIAGPPAQTRLLHVRYEDGSYGVVPADAVKIDGTPRQPAPEPGEGGTGTGAPDAASPAGPSDSQRGQGEPAQNRATPGVFGKVRDRQTGGVGMLIRGYTDEGGRRLVDVRINGEKRTFEASRFEPVYPGPRLAEETIAVNRGAVTPGVAQAAEAATAPAEPTAAPAAPKSNARLRRDARKILREDASLGVHALERVQRVLGLNEHEAVALVEENRGSLTPEQQASQDSRISDLYYLPDQKPLRGRGGNVMAGYRAARRRFLSGQGEPRKLLGRLKATWDAMSEGQRASLLERTDAALPHEKPGEGLELIQRAIEGVDSRFLEAPAEAPQSPQEAPAPDTPAEGADAGEAPGAPAGEGEPGKEPPPSRRHDDEGHTETPEERRMRRLEAIASGYKKRALTDKMTGLPNKAARLKATARIDAEGGAGWLFVDGKGVKAKNQESPEAGDQHIINLATALRVMAQEAGISGRLVFREGGDEFAVGGTREALAKLAEALKADGRYHVPEVKDTFKEASEAITDVAGKGKDAPAAPTEKAEASITGLSPSLRALPPVRDGYVRIFHGTKPENVGEIRARGIQTSAERGSVEDVPFVFGYAEPHESFGGSLVVADIPASDVSLSGKQIRVNRSVRPEEIVGSTEGDEVYVARTQLRAIQEGEATLEQAATFTENFVAGVRRRKAEVAPKPPAGVEGTPGFDPDKAKAYQPAGIARIIARAEAGRLNSADIKASLDLARDYLKRVEEDHAAAKAKGTNNGRNVTTIRQLKEGIANLRTALAAQKVREGGADPKTSGPRPGKVVKPPVAPDDKPTEIPESVTSGDQYAVGKDVEIRQQGTKERIPGRYALIPIELLLPSHNAGDRFARSDGYPEGLQPRDYSSDSGEQNKVMELVAGFDPAELINTAPRADAGPPTVAWDLQSGKFVVINGNGRAMAITEAYKDGAKFDAYSRALEDAQESFGFDAAENRGASGGVLVRIADLNPRGPKAVEFARRGNQPGGLRQKPSDRAAAEVALVSDTVLSELKLDSETTFAQAVNAPSGAGFRDALRKKMGAAGNDLFKEDGTLTDTGQEFVEAMFTIKAGFDKADLETLTPTMRRSVAGSVVQWLQLERNEATKQEAGQLRDALRWVAKELEGGKISLAEWEAQGGLFGKEGPQTLEERAMVVGLRELANKSRKLREALANLVQENVDPAQGTLLDVGPEPFISRFARAFGLHVSEGVIEIAQATRNGDLVGMPSAEDPIRADELLPSQREHMAAPDPIDTRIAAIGSLRLPLHAEPEGEWSGNTARRSDIIKALEELFSTPIRVGRSRAFGKAALGWFNTKTGAVRLKYANDIVVGSHEAGHSLESVVWPQMAGHAEFNAMRAEMRVLGMDLYGPNEPHNGYESEGFAEFMRLYLTRPELADRHAGKTLKWFEENFNPGDKKFRERLDGVRRMVKDYVQQGDENRILSSLVKGKLAPGPVRRVLRFFSGEKWIDDLLPMERLVAWAAEKKGSPLDPHSDPFLLADALRNTHNARAEYMAEVGMIDPAGRIVGPALSDSIGIVEKWAKKNNGTRDNAMDTFRAYLVAKRTLHLAQRGIRSGNVDLRDAVTLTERIERTAPELVTAAKQVWGWNRAVLTYAYQLGAIAPADYKALMKRSKFYVPFMRVQPDEVPGSRKGPGGGNAARSALSRITGSDRDIRDPFPAMVANAASLVRFAHRRAVIQRVADLARFPGLARHIEKVDRDVLKKVKPLEDFRAQLEKAGADLSDVDMNELLTWYEPKVLPDTKDPILPVVRENGKLEWYQVSREIWDSLQGMDPYRLPGALDLFLGAPARLKRLGTTGLRASFSLVTNPIRDLNTMMFQSESNNPAEIGAAWAKAQGHAVKRLFGKDAHYGDLWEAVRNGTLTMDAAVGTAQKRQGVPGVVRAAGLEMSQPLGIDMARTHRLGEHLGRNTRQRIGADLKKGRLLSAGGDFLDLMRDVFQIPEAGPRIAEAEIIAKRIGYKPGEPITFRQAMDAMILMKRGGAKVTVDFNAAGRYARIVNAAVPFFNVAIQGPRVFAKAAKRNPVYATFMGAGVTAMTLALWKQNRDKDWWKDLPWREKFSYWHIEADGQRVRIPRPFEPGILFAVLPEATMDSMYREDPETVKKAIDHAYEQLVPDWAPVLLQEGMEQLANEDSYRDSPIVPAGAQRLPAAEQYGTSSSVLATKLGEIMGWSAYRIDHAVNGIFGGVGSDAARAFGVVQKREHDFQPSDIPVLGRLFAHDGADGYASQAVQDFFDLRSNLQERTASKKNPATPQERLALRILERSARRLKTLREQRVDERTVDGRTRVLRQMRQAAQEAMRRAQEVLGG